MDRTFDLVISLEVAEHLSKNLSNQFIENLTKLGNVILFSAAIPGQGGTNHINEAFPDYWINIFNEKGYYPFDIVRRKIWDDSEIDFWYRQNIIIFANQSFIEDNPVIKNIQADINDSVSYLYNRIHPELYMIFVNEKVKLLSENIFFIKKAQLRKVLFERIKNESPADIKSFIKKYFPFLVKLKHRKRLP